jgi:hypothetical protein
MDASARSSPLVSTIAAVAVCVAAIGATASDLRARAPAELPPARPAADARVDVVKAPPEPVADRVSQPCTTCAMGAGRGLL